MSAQQRRWLIPLAICLLLLFLDQWTKLWIQATLGPDPLVNRISVIGDWLEIVYSRNTGIAFSLFQGMSPLLIVVSSLISIGAVYVYIFHLPNELFSVQLSMGLILGGAIGNIVDRIRVGYVIDFIKVGWFPIFNVADSAITVGATILALFLLFYHEDEEPEHDPQDDALLNDLLHRDIAPSPSTAALEADTDHVSSEQTIEIETPRS